jgi:GNAT superfamily N-acetyltransferase
MEIFPLSERAEFIKPLSLWAFGHWYVNRGIKFTAIEADYARRADFSNLPVTWVAVEDALPVGMVSLKEHDLTSHRNLTPWLSALYVIPQYRRRGIAVRLIDTVLCFAQVQEYNSVHLFTDHRKINYLTRYYLNRGWEIVEHTFDIEGNPTNIMSYRTAGLQVCTSAESGTEVSEYSRG